MYGAPSTSSLPYLLPVLVLLLLLPQLILILLLLRLVLLLLLLPVLHNNLPTPLPSNLFLGFLENQTKQ